jgi:cell division protease FtsH
MEMPQHDNQDPEQHTAKRPRRSARPKASRRRRWLYRCGIATCALLLLALVGFFAFDLMGSTKHVDVEQRPISDILNMADQHLLRSVTVSGSTITAIGRGGQRYQSTKEDGQAVTDAFRKDGVSVSVDDGQDAGWLPVVLDVLFVGVALALLSVMLRRTGVGGAAAFSRARARRFQETRPLVLFKDVAGVEEAKQELSEIVEFLKNPARFLSMGARIPRGVLLVGAPGTGKTLISRAVAGEADVSFYSISGSEFVEMFVGVGAARVRDLFKEAREHAPCIVFIDEIDAVGRQRNTASTNGNDEREQTLNQLLVEMDGFDTQTNIVVIAATNRPDVLDPALLRPGRFDRQVMLDKPDIRGRQAILEVHARGKPLAPAVALSSLARQTVGFSGADLANLLNEAALLAARNQRDLIEQRDLDEAVLRVLAGPQRKSRVITADEKAIIAYHEVGHAIVMRSIPGSDPVQKVTAIARGLALGITVSVPAEDRYLLRRSELLAKLAGLMGGRAAEELVFGDITTGASQDIEQATRLARRMVCEFGMSPLGLISLKSEGEGAAAVSAQMAARIDHEVAQLVEQAYQTALEVLRARREKLSLIAEHLIDVETIEGAQLDILLFAA